MRQAIRSPWVRSPGPAPTRRSRRSRRSPVPARCPWPEATAAPRDETRRIPCRSGAGPAATIETDAPLLAVALSHYMEAEGITWDQLATNLGCTTESLDAVAMCRPPRKDHFSADVTSIAGKFVDAKRLLPLLRRLQIIEAFRQEDTFQAAGSRQDVGLLLAARDRDEEISAKVATDVEPIETPTVSASSDSEIGKPQ